MPTKKVSREKWLVAALQALAESGVRGVAIEPLARRLGVTRGSFYWHFRDREALLTEALERWEQVSTTDYIERVSAVRDPRERLQRLLHDALTDDEISGLEPAIVAHADHPVVNAMLERVTRRRLDYLAEIYAELGMAEAEARLQAVAAYSAYLGWVELRRTAGAVAPETAAADNRTTRAALEHLLALVTPPAAE